MNEKLLKKIKKYLGKAGIDEEKAAKFLAELENDVEEDVDETTAPVVEEPVKDKEPNEKEVEEPKPTEEPVDGKKEKGDEVPQEGTDKLPPEEETVAPVDPVDPVGEEPVEQVPAAPVPPVGGVSLEEFQKAIDELNEKVAVIEGLTKRIGSLEEALKAAGVITGEVDATSVETLPTAPGNPVTPASGLDDFLAQVNNGQVKY